MLVCKWYFKNEVIPHSRITQKSIFICKLLSHHHTLILRGFDINHYLSY